MLWQYLAQLGSCIHLPWCVIGDFNQPLSGAEKIGGWGVSFQQSSPLWDMITECNFMELDFHGPHFTWSNMRDGDRNIQQCIDMGFYYL